MVNAMLIDVTSWVFQLPATPPYWKTGLTKSIQLFCGWRRRIKLIFSLASTHVTILELKVYIFFLVLIPLIKETKHGKLSTVSLVIKLCPQNDEAEGTNAFCFNIYKLV
jgi:hypothetical protein